MQGSALESRVDILGRRISVAVARLELLGYRFERPEDVLEKRTRSNYPYSVPIAPDIFHKADVSGGLPYELAMPATVTELVQNEG